MTFFSQHSDKKLTEATYQRGIYIGSWFQRPNCGREGIVGYLSNGRNMWQRFVFMDQEAGIMLGTVISGQSLGWYFQGLGFLPKELKLRSHGDLQEIR